MVANEVVELLHKLYTPHLQINGVLISQITFVPRFVQQHYQSFFDGLREFSNINRFHSHTMLW